MNETQQQITLELHINRKQTLIVPVVNLRTNFLILNKEHKKLQLCMATWKTNEPYLFRIMNSNNLIMWQITTHNFIDGFIKGLKKLGYECNHKKIIYDLQNYLTTSLLTPEQEY